VANKAGRRGFGYIRRLPSGRFHASYVGPDTKRHNAPSTFQTRGDAEGWLNNRRNEIRDGEWVPGRAKRASVTLGEFADRWLEQRRKADGTLLAPRTRAHYRKLLDDFILPGLGGLPMKAITPETVDEWYGQLDTGPVYRAHAYSLLRTILDSALSARYRLIAANPCQIPGAGNSKRVHDVQPATLDELAAIVEAIPARYEAMILLAAWTALRYGELIALTRADVNQTTGVVRVRRGITWVEGKPVVGPPKSEAGVRGVHIPPHLLPAIKEHLREHVGKGRDALLFPARGGGYMRPASLYRVWYPAREAAGRPDLHFHDLRHTGATLAAQTGATLAELMQRLGHSTPSAAMRYQHAALLRDKAIAERLSELAGE